VTRAYVGSEMWVSGDAKPPDVAPVALPCNRWVLSSDFCFKRLFNWS
jgi:hypothetical protein